MLLIKIFRVFFLCLIQLFLLLGLSAQVNAFESNRAEIELIYQSKGDSVGDFVEYDLSEYKEPILIRVSQESADYSLEVICNGDVITNVDLDAYFAMEEHLFFSNQNKKTCKLRILPAEKIDQNSPYKLFLYRFAKLTEDQRASYIDFNSAATYYSSLKNNAGAEEGEYKQAAKLLQKISSTNRLDLDTQGLAEFRSILALYSAGEVEAVEPMIRQKETDSSLLPKYRLAMIYELTGLERDQLKIEQLFELGQKLSKENRMNFSKPYFDSVIAISKIREGNFEEAFSRLSAALKQHIETKNWREQLTTLHNLSWGYFRAGNYDKAISHAAELKLLAQQHDDKGNLLWGLYDLVEAYYAKGDNTQADRFRNAALKGINQFGFETDVEIKSLKAYLLQNKIRRNVAFGRHQIALDTIPELRKLYETLGDPRRAAELDRRHAEIAIALGDYKKAIKSTIRANEYDRNNNRIISLTSGLVKLADIYLEHGNLERSNATFAKINETPDTSDKTETAKYLLVKAKLARKNKRLSIAQSALKSANLITEFIEPLLALQIGLQQALLLEELEHFDQANQKAEELLRKINSLLLNLANNRDRLLFKALQKNIYETLIRLNLVVSDKPAITSLNLAEQFRFNKFSHAHWGETGSRLTVEQSQRRDEILSNLAMLTPESSIPKTAFSQKLQADIRKLVMELEELELESFEPSTTFDIESNIIQAVNLGQYKDGHAALAYFFGQQDSWIWKIENQQVSVKKISPSLDDLRAMRNYSQLISTQPENRGDLTAWQQKKIQRQVSNILLTSASDFLASSELKKLTIVSDGAATDIPFASLLLPSSDTLVIEKTAIAYSTSISSASESNPRTMKSYDSALLFSASQNYQGEHVTLPTLKDAELEVKRIARLFGDRATIYNDGFATKANFKSATEESYDLLHLAAHGITNKQEPIASGLILTGNNPQDRILLEPEIRILNGIPRLVVLSSCSSATGLKIDGAGLLSLSSSFIDAGARQVIGTLWNVEDEITRVHFEHFYHALVNLKLDSVNALRYAQKRIISSENRRWSDPYYWAGFNLIESF